MALPRPLFPRARGLHPIGSSLSNLPLGAVPSPMGAASSLMGAGFLSTNAAKTAVLARIMRMDLRCWPLRAEPGESEGTSRRLRPARRAGDPAQGPAQARGLQDAGGVGRMMSVALVVCPAYSSSVNLSGGTHERS